MGFLGKLILVIILFMIHPVLAFVPILFWLSDING
jgi:hypothetical protein